MARVKTCNGCGEEKEIVYGWSTRNRAFCIDCMPKKEKKPIKQKQYRKPAPRVPYKMPGKTESQKAKEKEDKRIKKLIWEHRDQKCEECGREFGDISECDASHLMSKGAHPELRHEEQDIVLHCRFPCHQRWEHGDRRNMKTWTKHIDWMVANGYVIQTE